MIFPHAIWTNPYAVSEAILRSKGKIIVDISKHMYCHSWLESGHDGRWAWWSSIFRHKHPLCPDLWLTLDLFWGWLRKVYESVPLNFFSLMFRSSWNRRKCCGGSAEDQPSLMLPQSLRVKTERGRGKNLSSLLKPDSTEGHKEIKTPTLKAKQDNNCACLALNLEGKACVTGTPSYHGEWFIDIYQEWIDQRQWDDRWSIKCQIKTSNQVESWFFSGWVWQEKNELSYYTSEKQNPSILLKKQLSNPKGRKKSFTSSDVLIH